MPGGQTTNEFEARKDHEILAVYLAEELDDFKSLSLYLSYARRYPDQFLKAMLMEAKRVPAEKIRKNRGALFNYLVQKYAQKTNDNHRS